MFATCRANLSASSVPSAAARLACTTMSQKTHACIWHDSVLSMRSRKGRERLHLSPLHLIAWSCALLESPAALMLRRQSHVAPAVQSVSRSRPIQSGCWGALVERRRPQQLQNKVHCMYAAAANVRHAWPATQWPHTRLDAKGDFCTLSIRLFSLRARSSSPIDGCIDDCLLCADES